MIAASVWITSRIGRPPAESISRPTALMMPVVRVWSSPNGLPMANTFWPTSRSAERPTGMGRSLAAGASMCSTARSFSGAAPTSRASHSEWSERVTRAALEPWTTWKLVTTWPWSSHRKPEPVPRGTSSRLRLKAVRPRVRVVM